MIKYRGSNTFGNKNMISQPSFLLAKERVNERSDVRVSASASGVNVNALAVLTHPDDAALVDLLSAFGAKKVKKKINLP